VDTNNGSPLIDDLFYYSHNHDVWNAKVDADLHYSVVGWKEGRDPSAFFDTSFYQATSPDVAGVNPLGHFDTIGCGSWRSSRATTTPTYPWISGSRSRRPSWSAHI
jgi:serralysin